MGPMTNKVIPDSLQCREKCTAEQFVEAEDEGSVMMVTWVSERAMAKKNNGWV